MGKTNEHTAEAPNRVDTDGNLALVLHRVRHAFQHQNSADQTKPHIPVQNFQPSNSNQSTTTRRRPNFCSRNILFTETCSTNRSHSTETSTQPKYNVIKRQLYTSFVVRLPGVLANRRGACGQSQRKRAHSFIFAVRCCCTATMALRVKNRREQCFKAFFDLSQPARHVAYRYTGNKSSRVLLVCGCALVPFGNAAI